MKTTRRAILLGICAVLSASLLCGEARAADQKMEESYTLGYQFGENMKTLGLLVDQDAVVAAVRDGLAGKPPAIGMDRYREVYEQLQRRIVTIQQRRAAEAAAKAKEGGAKAPAAAPAPASPAPAAQPGR